MNSNLLIAACVISALGTTEAIYSPVAEAQLLQPGLCQSAFAFQTNNDFGDCVPALSIGTNPPPSMEVYARRSDLQLAKAEAQYNSTVATNYGQWVAKNGINSTRVATSSIQCSANDNGPARYLCEPGGQPVALQKTGYNRVVRR